MARTSPYGVYLTDGTDEVLLPNNQPVDFRAGQKIEAFIYNDSEDRIIATLDEPYATADEFAWLEVVDVNRVGAFMNWGLAKDLFVPYGQQPNPFKKGYFYLVRIVFDEISKRLIGVGFLKPFLNKDTSSLEVNQKIDALVYHKDKLGYHCIVENQYHGMLFYSDAFEKYKPGKGLDLYIKNIREDGKLDLSMTPIGYGAVEGEAEKFLEMLKDHGGVIPYTSKSPADLIQSDLGMSKKLFKKIVGNLYKQRLITITEDDIRIVE